MNSKSLTCEMLGMPYPGNIVGDRNGFDYC